MAYLRILKGDRLLEQRELTAERTTIGRTADNDIVLNGRGISRHHATIERDGDSFVLVDNDSANGSYLNGKRISRQTLSFWDEVQVYDYVLKFMAVTRSKGEEVAEADFGGARVQQEKTIEVDISTLGDLAELRRRTRIPHVFLVGHDTDQPHFVLDKVNFTIGNSRACDIRTSGWLAPRLAARIQRRNDACFLQPKRRGRVFVNEHRVLEPVELNDGDEFEVRGLTLRYVLRPLEIG
jgi:pSer/pThr/pTyr-binding forkhead associated (FHA) protein